MVQLRGRVVRRVVLIYKLGGVRSLLMGGYVLFLPISLVITGPGPVFTVA